MPRLVSIVLAALAMFGTRPASAGDLPPTAEQAPKAPAEESLFQLINSERRSRSVRPLEWDETLAELARAHALDMRWFGVASHHSSGDNATFTERLARTDLIVRRNAENVAIAHDVLDAHLWLMRSDGHRANLLDPELTDVGIGVVTAWDGAVYVVQDFATIVHPVSDEEAASIVRAELRRAKLVLAGVPPAESPDLTREAGRLALETWERDTVAAPRAPRVEHDIAYFYTTLDPLELPESVRDAVSTSREFGVGAYFRASPRHANGTYWVVVLFRNVG